MNFIDEILCNSTDMDVKTYRMKREFDEKIMKEAGACRYSLINLHMRHLEMLIYIILNQLIYRI